MPYLSVGLLSASGSDPEHLWPLKVEGLRTFSALRPAVYRAAMRPHHSVIGFDLQLSMTLPSLAAGHFFCQLDEEYISQSHRG